METLKQYQPEILSSALLCDHVYSYATNPELGAIALKKDFSDFDQNDFFWFDIKETDTQAFIFSTKDYIYLVFQGTQSPHDWVVNANLDLISFESGHCHRGFHETSTKTYPQIGEKLIELSKLNPHKKIVITGHSLGGAMAQMYALLIKRNVPDFRIHLLVTFGQPRTGNQNHSEYYNSLNIPFVRLINDGDYISDVPPPAGRANWSHAGKGYLCRNGRIETYPDLYEKEYLTRLLLTFLNWVNLKFIKKTWNDEEFEKMTANHKMSLYIHNLREFLKHENKSL